MKNTVLNHYAFFTELIFFINIYLKQNRFFRIFSFISPDYFKEFWEYLLSISLKVDTNILAEFNIKVEAFLSLQKVT